MEQSTFVVPPTYFTDNRRTGLLKPHEVNLFLSLFPTTFAIKIKLLFITLYASYLANLILFIVYVGILPA